MMNIALNRISGTMARPAPRRQMYVAPVALLAAGLLLAISTNLAKVAQGFGFTPLAYLTWSLAGATVLLTSISHLRGKSVRLTRRTVEYFFVAGFLTTGATNLIFFAAVTHLGVSFVALLIALPPLLTYVGALLLRIEGFCWWRAAGVALALAGAAILVMRKWSSPDGDQVWIVITLVGPVLLAAGNLYRTLRWPPGASAEALAPGMLLGAMGILVPFSLLPGWTLSVPTEDAGAMALLALQATVFAAQFFMLFVLQRAGGPVFLSLMGGVSAIFGVPIAMMLHDEAVMPAFLTSALLVAAGIACMLYGARACRGRL